PNQMIIKSPQSHKYTLFIILFNIATNTIRLRIHSEANSKSKLKLTKDEILAKRHKNIVGLSRLLL
ncbi:MAG: hypothetical protein ACKPGB_10430, partial [Dolichospermum sp.]